MNNDVLTSILSLHSKVDGVSTDVKDLTNSFNNLECPVNKEKLDKLEKIVYGACKIVLVAFVLAVVALVSSNGNHNSKAVANPAVSKALKVR